MFNKSNDENVLFNVFNLNLKKKIMIFKEVDN